MIPTRTDEPDYAKLADVSSSSDLAASAAKSDGVIGRLGRKTAPSGNGAEALNRYGSPIQLLPDGDNGTSLRINGDAGIGGNPNRTRQHAFHFTADNCIGCHACEAACSEKNDLPPHLSFRSVGYVEGGAYPDYARINISMACNHCDDPVCLKGCPTRAYTKHPEYGAVIQDPDICFGCGYCTWVCPYNAPQLDPLAGQVEKCNMCVDRLEVGLKPACVSACVGNALDFGVVENMPNGREQVEARLPGFPDPAITHPNIRFQQVKQLPQEVTRPDSEPVKYLRNGDGGFQPTVDAKDGKARHWSLRRLSSRENPLVAFTLAVQAAVGAFVTAHVADHAGVWLSLAVLALLGLGMLASTAHLGKPTRFYRGFNNLRHSNLSREALATVVFGGAVALFLLARLAGFERAAFALAWSAVAAGAATVYFMVRCYLIPARPFWNHWQSGAAFVGASLSLGGWMALAFAPGYPSMLLAAILAGMLIEGVGLAFHARHLRAAEHEGAASHYVQTTTFGNTYIARNALLAANVVAVGCLWVTGTEHPLAWLLAGAVGISVSLVGRALFYVVVVPTTMPGAFFWKNKAFEQHARDLGLAANPAVGVAPTDH